MDIAPISWRPSQYWDGNVGSWSSFALRIGTPEQIVRVLPSTAGQATWAIAPSGCPPDVTTPSTTCSDSRGGLFNVTQSASWDRLGNYTLGLDANLGYGDLSALYGLETVALGYGGDLGGPTLQSQIVAAIVPEIYYVGLFGLNHQATNLTVFGDPHKSYLTTLKEEHHIPSLSWAYTAGAPYRSKGVFGSLTFGGYDTSRYEPNNVTLHLAEDVTRDLVVSLQAITASHRDGAKQNLLPDPILTFIDSTQPIMYLPTDSCKAFENAFNLVWNDTTQTYWVDDELHSTLLVMNATITFTIGNSLRGGATVDIELPYKSFDLQVKPPAVESTARFFPLRRAANESQYILGRTFMQEAYVITNYETSTFSVSQAKFDEGLRENIVAIDPTSTNGSSNTTTTSAQPSATSRPSRVNQSVIIGASIAATLFVLCLIVFIVILLRRARRISDMQIKPNSSTSSLHTRNPSIRGFREIGQNSIVGPSRELPDSGKAELLGSQSPSASNNNKTEMLATLPVVFHELRTHRSSMEKLIRPACRATTVTIFDISSPPGSRVCSFVSADVNSQAWSETSGLATQRGLEISPATSRPRTVIHIPDSRKLLDLSRPLPPVPLPESPTLRRDSSLYRWLETLLPNRGILQALEDLGVPNTRHSDAALSVPKTATASDRRGLGWPGPGFF